MAVLTDLPSECLQQCWPAQRVQLGILVCRAWREQLLCKLQGVGGVNINDDVPVVELRARARAFAVEGSETRATALLCQFNRPGVCTHR